MKKSISTIIIALITIGSLFAVKIPEKPYPPRLVNDFAGMLNTDEINLLEQKLVDFSNRSTTQIVIVIVDSLYGEDKAMVATEIGQQWGVGSAEFDNGIVLLIKPKTPDEKGEVFIATGHGLEGVIPDAIAKRIVENEMIPSFKTENYYEGIEKAVNTLMELSLGDYSAKEYEERTQSVVPPGAVLGLVLIIFIIISLLSRTNRISRRSIGRGIPFWILLSMMGSGSRSKGSWGNFSSGSGSFGGGGGGFGGFGGGSFGGGGAGGSW